MMTAEDVSPRRTKLLLGTIVLFVLLGINVFVGLKSTKHLLENQSAIGRSQEVSGAAERLLYNLHDVQREQSSDLVTGESGEFEFYQAGVRAIAQDLDLLHLWIGPDPAQQVRARELRTAIEEHLDLLDQRSLKGTPGEVLIAQAPPETALDMAAIARAREIISTIQSVERVTLARHGAQMKQRISAARWGHIASGAVGAILMFFVIGLLFGARRVQARTDARDMSARLEAQAERERLLDSARAARGAAEAASRAKDEFIAVVSHELRTPLQGIMGWVDVLKRTQDDSAQSSRALERIEANVKFQAQIVEDLLNVARMISGKLELHLEEVAIDDVVSASVQTLRPAAEAKGIDLRLMIESPGTKIMADPARLHQILVNLLSNAVKFTPKGGEVSLRARLVGSQAEFEVKDSGIGIASGLLERIFGGYFQLTTSTTRRYGGLGLGLAIVKHLAERHGGTVSAYSEGEGKGATFTVRLPLEEMTPVPNHKTITDAPAPPVENKTSIAGLRLLVVDDEADAREVLRTLLVAQGAKVDVAQSATEAISKLRDARFDLLLSDVGMPGMDGYALMRTLRNTPPNAWATPPTVPALALTAFDSAADRSHALDAGFDEHLGKPVDIDALFAKVAQRAGRVHTSPVRPKQR